MALVERTEEEPCNAVDDDVFDAAVAAFEAVWQAGDVPDIRTFLAATPHADERRTSLLHELIRVDLEYRWKSDARPAEDRPPHRGIEDYLALFSEVGSVAKLPLDLIAEEYRVRHRWGDRPDPVEFARRFAEHAEELAAALAKIDGELQKEKLDEPPSIDAHAVLSTHDLTDVPQFDYRDFVLEAHLGSGGIGKVYRAWWKSRKKYVAIKMLRRNWWRQMGADGLFFREAAILVELEHPNIVRMHGIGRTPHGACFLVMQLIDGGDLSLRGVAPVAQAIEWVAQAADGLAFAHRQGIVHRDVKPSNLLLDREGGVHVADFGLALVTAVTHHREDGLIGTAAYMAPEQLFGGVRQVTPASDIFSLGAVSYALLTGQPPYQGRSMLDIVERRLGGAQPVSLRSLRSDLSEGLAAVVTRCLAHEPSRRFAKAEELAAALRSAAQI